MQIGAPVGEREDGDRDRIAVEVRNGKANAFNGYGAFVHHPGARLLRNFDLERPVCSLGVEGRIGWGDDGVKSDKRAAAVDVPLQLFQFKRALRMTRQELRDEAKESDGRPETKQRIRQLQQTIARRRMMHKVPMADVVIVNPTHFAVALKYDPKNMRAPRVLAKGADLIAQNIRRIAQENRVPIFESPKLARALYRSADLNQEIPAGLYLAVAQVLSYVFRIRTLNPTLAARLARPEPTLGDEYADV